MPVTEFIDKPTLASYPGVGLTAETADSIPDIVVNLTNELIDEVVDDVLGDGVVPDPIPARIRAIALEVAARSLRYAAGAESISTAIDDWKKTVRFPTDKFTAGLYLTDDEEARIRRALRGRFTRKPVGTIRLSVPGYGRGTYPG